MTRQQILGVLLFVGLVAFTLWLSWPPTISPRPVDYLCADGDTVTVLPVDTGRVQLLRPAIAETPLERRPSGVGTTYQDSDSGILFWARGPFAVLHQSNQVLHHGCTARSARSERADSLHWYASNAHLEVWHFALSHPRDTRISRPNDRYTRFLSVGPQNEPPALTDGFSVVVGIHRHRETIREYVEKEINSPAPAATPVLSPPTDTTHRGRKAIVWRQESAMGSPVTHWAIALDSTTVATVAVSVVGPNPQRHDQRANRMRRSLRFWRTTSAHADSTTVPLAFLTDPDGSPDRGCDDIKYISHRIARTPDRLSAALAALFAIDRDSVRGARHFLGQTNETLRFDRVTVRDDTARVYLQGRLSGLQGICDDPRARIQIEETIRKSAPVRSVQFYLNGTPTTLRPDRQGTPS